MIRYEDIQEKVEAYLPAADFDLLRRAYVFSAVEHRAQVRRSGEPYLIHPLEVAGILADLRLDLTCIIVGLLHDVVEDTLTTTEVIREYFGRDIAHIVEGVTKLSRIKFRSKEEQQAENLRKMLLAMVDDIRVILVKLADRLHNMRTLGFLAPSKQKAIARETREIYAPIAHRLGIGRIKSELEDLSLKFTDPEGYASLMKQLELNRKVSAGFIEEISGRIRDAVEAQGIRPEITGRIKSAYSIHRKMIRQKIGVEQVYDYVAFRLLTPAVKDCYAALGIIHSLWRPVPGRFRDFIAMPKPNGYQSLHTSVMSGRGQPFEVQIRTPEMHRIAEEGIAAHWSYKEGDIKAEAEDVSSVQWLRQYMEILQDVKDPREFLRVARMDLYPEEVYVFTPKGDVKGFPRGATAIDCAYAIQTDIGAHCTGARINGRFVPLRTVIQSGDIVEITTSPAQHPSRDWLSMVATSRARSKIRQWLNVHERERSIAMGKELAGREFRRFRFNPRRFPEERVKEVLRSLNLESYQDFLAAVGYGKLAPSVLISRLAPDLQPEKKQESRFTKVFRKALRVGGPQIVVKGVGDVLVYLAQCCAPIPGEEITGYITRGRGVSVHAVTCRNVENLLYDSERHIEVAWARGLKKKATHP
ncbi:MAG: RelA/SpoT family protein, partial [Acidobacteriota bacterium]